MKSGKKKRKRKKKRERPIWFLFSTGSLSLSLKWDFSHYELWSVMVHGVVKLCKGYVVRN